MNSLKDITQNNKLPLHPESVYKDEWKGWTDLLGHINIWTKKEVLTFIIALEEELELLDPIEILMIVEQSGAKTMLKKNKSFKSLLDSSPYSVDRKENIAQLKKEFGISDVIEDGTDEFHSKEELENLLTDSSNKSEILENALNSICSIDNPPEILACNYLRELKAFDTQGMSCYTTDHETIERLVKYRIDRFWNDVMSKNYDINILRNENGGKYFTIIKHRFLEEYDKVINIKVPLDYQFKDNDGNIAQPNLMQKLIVYRLGVYKKYANWSSMGSGKTLSAILAGRVEKLKTTLIITFNSNLEDWEGCILNTFPNHSKIYSKERNVIPKLSNENYNYIIFNYETFQQENIESIIDSIIDKNIDFIILDEVQLVKQRFEETYSIRRRVVESLIRSIECKNVKNKKETYRLVMSATPVINNLLEPKKTLELLNGVKYTDLKTQPTVNNALSINKQMFIHGIRFRPSYDIKVDTKIIKIDGTHLINCYKNIPDNSTLEKEKIFIPDKLLSIRSHVKPGTMIYTHYVTGIVEPVKQFVEMLGFSVGVYTGQDKSGLQSFKDKKCDVLICSSPIGTGVDGLQRVCNQLIILTLPWTNSEYENLLGRIIRQGTAFDEITIIVPQVSLGIKENSYSYDVNRMNIVDNKKALSNIVLDAIIPSHLIPSPEELIKEASVKFKKWIQRIEKEGLIKLNRERLIICSETEDVIEIPQSPIKELSEKVDEIIKTESKPITTEPKSIIVETKFISKESKPIITEPKPISTKTEKIIDENLSSKPSNIVGKIMVPEDDNLPGTVCLNKPKTICLNINFWAEVLMSEPTDNEIYYLKKNFQEDLDSLYDEQIFELLKDNYYLPKREDAIYSVNFPDYKIDNVGEKIFFVSIELYLHTINSIQKDISYPISFRNGTALCGEIVRLYERISHLNCFRKNGTFNITKEKPVEIKKGKKLKNE